MLVVEEDPVVRHKVMALLKDRFDVIAVSSGVQLPELLKTHKPALIILDVILPWLDGFELCRIIKTDVFGWRIPVLFLTECIEREDELTVKEVGGNGYLTKPFFPKDLFREVHRLLAA